MNMEFLNTILQGLILYLLHRIDGRLDSHSQRLRELEISCAKNHAEEHKP